MILWESVSLVAGVDKNEIRTCLKYFLKLKEKCLWYFGFTFYDGPINANDSKQGLLVKIERLSSESF